MNPMMENLKKIMRLCMEVMNDTAERMNKASIEVPELADHAAELRRASGIMQSWIEGITP
jgi:hypothetical protein